MGRKKEKGSKDVVGDPSGAIENQDLSFTPSDDHDTLDLQPDGEGQEAVYPIAFIDVRDIVGDSRYQTRVDDFNPQTIDGEPNKDQELVDTILTTGLQGPVRVQVYRPSADELEHIAPLESAGDPVGGLFSRTYYRTVWGHRRIEATRYIMETLHPERTLIRAEVVPEDVDTSMMTFAENTGRKDPEPYGIARAMANWLEDNPDKNILHFVEQSGFPETTTYRLHNAWQREETRTLLQDGTSPSALQLLVPVFERLEGEDGWDGEQRMAAAAKLRGLTLSKAQQLKKAFDEKIEPEEAFELALGSQESEPSTRTHRKKSATPTGKRKKKAAARDPEQAIQVRFVPSRLAGDVNNYMRETLVYDEELIAYVSDCIDAHTYGVDDKNAFYAVLIFVSNYMLFNGLEDLPDEETMDQVIVQINRTMTDATYASALRTMLTLRDKVRLLSVMASNSARAEEDEQVIRYLFSYFEE